MGLEMGWIITTIHACVLKRRMESNGDPSGYELSVLKWSDYAATSPYSCLNTLLGATTFITLAT